MIPIYNMCWLMLVQITPGATGGDGNAVGEGAADPAPQGIFGNMFFFWAMLMVVIFYVLFMGRPQDKGKGAAASAERLAGLKKNDRVVTAGGIIGTVVNIRDDLDHISIRVDESTGARMQILKQSIARVMNDEDEKAE